MWGKEYVCLIFFQAILVAPILGHIRNHSSPKVIKEKHIQSLYVWGNRKIIPELVEKRNRLRKVDLKTVSCEHLNHTMGIRGFGLVLKSWISCKWNHRLVIEQICPGVVVINGTAGAHELTLPLLKFESVFVVLPVLYNCLESCKHYLCLGYHQSH